MPRFLPFALLLALAACHSGAPRPTRPPTAGRPPSAGAVVTAGAGQRDNVTDVLRLSALSAYPAKDVLRATTTGYLLAPVPGPGQRVAPGQAIFTLQTKESRVLHLDKLTGDPRLRFSGIIRIKASQTGVPATVDKLVGDYVQDGEQLALNYDRARFGFVLDVPVTQLRYVRVGQPRRIRLPDGRTLPGRVAEGLATADDALQTQRYTVRPTGPVPELPGNLAVQVEVDRTAPRLTPTLPRAAVLADETQTQFWVMRLLNDSTAAKVPVRVGAQQADRIEIQSSTFGPRNKILLSGNYGFDDTATVQVARRENP